jgi:hypothetical protein
MVFPYKIRLRADWIVVILAQDCRQWMTGTTEARWK